MLLFDVALLIALLYIAANYVIVMIGMLGHRAASARLQRLPKISVIIPAKEEESVIEVTLRRLRKSYGNLEIIVVDSSKNNMTKKIARKYGAKVLADTAGRGKAHALNMGIEKAGGEFLYFIDADSMVTPSTIRQLVSSIGTHDACVGFVIARGNSVASLLGELETLFLNAANFWVSTMLGTAFVIGRNYIIRRSALRELGNFDSVLSEDINLSYKLYSGGKRVVFNPGAVCYERAPKQISHFFRQQERWGAGSFHEIGKSMRTHALLSITLFFIAMFYVFTPAFLLLAAANSLFAIPGVAGLLPLAYLSFKHLNRQRLPLVPVALVLMMAIFLAVSLNLIIKKTLGLKVGWYKTPR